MSINKVIYGDSTLIDLTSDSVTASALMSGVTAHDSSGALITGTIAAKTSADITVAGPTVTVPSGYYPAAVSKTIPDAVLNTNFSLSLGNLNYSLNSGTGLLSITGSVSKQDDSVRYSSGAGYDSYVDNNIRITTTVSSNYQLPIAAAATITPTESAQTAVASGKYTTGAITVAAISSDYVGSNIAIRSAADLTVNGSKITAPAGYYSSSVSANVASGSFKTDLITQIIPQINFNINTGKITAYADSTFYISPINNSGYFTTSDSLYLDCWGTSSSNIPILGAVNYTPSTAVQTIASHQYLTGAQTIAGDTNLVPSNIASGVSIFGVTGTHTGGVDTSNDTVTESALLSGYTAHDSTGTQITGSVNFANYYTGSSAPSSSLGADDDLYLQTGSIAHVSNTTLVIDSLVTGNVLVL